MKARVEKNAEYRKGYPWLVLITRDSWGEYIDSWHTTKREAQAVADDINNA